MNINYQPVRPGAKPPHRAHPTDAGADLTASLDDPVTLEPGQRRLIPTGVEESWLYVIISKEMFN